MDKALFLKLLENYAGTSPEEAKELASLRRQFPYSQVLHTLCARASKDHGLDSQQRDLQLAAVYSADRSRLKEIMLRPSEDPVRQVISKHVDADEQVVSTLEAADVADVVMDDLERLSRLKNTFENLFLDSHPDEQEGAESEVKEEERRKEATPGAAGPAVSEKPSLSPIKSKKERIIEMARAMNNGTGGEQIPKKKRGDREGHPADSLIAEIQSSKKEIVPEGDRQKQQMEIINQFIRVQPSISSLKDRMPPVAADLTPVKSGEFGENIVSETLVEILVKQGKKDKAIEVLKKLIWKYPQKKAYFASQIEELKK